MFNDLLAGFTTKAETWALGLKEKRSNFIIKRSIMFSFLCCLLVSEVDAKNKMK